jgi:adenylosuccinate lyase
MNRFDSVSPLDYRYYGDTPELFSRLQPYVSAAADIRYLLRIEVALGRMLARWGVCSVDVAKQIEAAGDQIVPAEVYEEEQRVHHNIRALVNCIRRRLKPEAQPFVHLFATSADVMDTAAALRYKELVRDFLLPQLITLEEQLIEMARANADQIQIGRTHGQHAVPTTFGYALALYVSRLGSRIQLIDQTHRNLRGKFSGAVGAFNSISLLDPTDPVKFELELLSELGLKPSETSTSSQVVEPEPITDLLYAVTSCFSVLANLADDIRHLIRSEIGELVDTYEDGEVGSSTMPHKMNPKNFENVKSMWKAFMPRMVTVFMDQISEHQRDLTNSASSRFIPELFTAFCYAVFRMKDALNKIQTNPVQMKKHLDAGKQHCVAEPLYLMLALQGYPDAYDRVMKLSREARKTGSSLVDEVKKDPRLAEYLTKLPQHHKDILADPARYIGDAPGRTIATCDYWELQSDRIKRMLEADSTDAQNRWAGGSREIHSGAY